MDFEDIPASSNQPEFDPAEANDGIPESSSDAFATYGGSQEASVGDAEFDAVPEASNDAFAAIAEPEDELAYLFK